MARSNDIAGATVVIAGASSGFGRGAAEELARRGANVVVAARRGDVLQALARRIGGEGGEVTAVTTDVSDPTAIDHLKARALAEYGHIDVWVNNVGVGALGFWEIPIDVHDRLVDVNLKGLIFGAHAALGHFVERGSGTLVDTGSIDSEVPIGLQNTYAATKAAVLSLGRSLNEELRLAGFDGAIRVATVMPWAVDTPWWQHAANYTGRTPRMVAMDDPGIVVDAIVEACTDPREEMPVGAKARASDISHHLFPDLTERMSSKVAGRQSKRGDTAAASAGALFEPMPEGITVGGGVRERMEREDSAR